MVSFRLTAVAAALFIVGASAHKAHVHPTHAPTTTTAPSKYGKYGKYMYPTAAPEAKCTAPKDRCAGAPGKPYVEYIGCCGDNACVSAPDMGWGRFCLPKPEPKYGAAPKCHKLGERCMGAKGYEYVEWLGCCGGASCEEDPAMGWGSFCKPGPHYDPYYAHDEAYPTEAPYHYHEPAAEPTPSSYYKYYYPTMAPTMAPTAAPKSYGYNYYGYGKKATDAPTTGSDDFVALGASFGCEFDGEGTAPASAESETEPVSDVADGQVAIFQTITISPPSDDPTCTLSASTVTIDDAQALLDTLCEAANEEADGTVLCRFISIEDGTPITRMLNQDMNVVARQAGAAVDLTYELVCDAADAANVLAALADVVPAGNDAPAFVAPETAATAAPVTTAVTELPEESAEE